MTERVFVSTERQRKREREVCVHRVNQRGGKDTESRFSWFKDAEYRSAASLRCRYTVCSLKSQPCSLAGIKRARNTKSYRRAFASLPFAHRMGSTGRNTMSESSRVEETLFSRPSASNVHLESCSRLRTVLDHGDSR